MHNDDFPALPVAAPSVSGAIEELHPCGLPSVSYKILYNLFLWALCGLLFTLCVPTVESRSTVSGQTGSAALGGTAFHPSSSEGTGGGALRGAPGQVGLVFRVIFSCSSRESHASGNNNFGILGLIRRSRVGDGMLVSLPLAHWHQSLFFL